MFLMFGKSVPSKLLNYYKVFQNEKMKTLNYTKNTSLQCDSNDAKRANEIKTFQMRNKKQNQGYNQAQEI